MANKQFHDPGVETIRAFGELEVKLSDAQAGVAAGTINPGAGAGTAPKLAATAMTAELDAAVVKIPAGYVGERAAITSRRSALGL